MHKYRKKALTILISLLALFALIAAYAFLQIQREIAILGIGLSYYEENLIILALAALSMIKVVYEIYQIEHHEEFEERIKTQLIHAEK